MSHPTDKLPPSVQPLLDASWAHWLVQRVRPSIRGEAHLYSLLPDGFAAYARIPPSGILAGVGRAASLGRSRGSSRDGLAPRGGLREAGRIQYGASGGPATRAIARGGSTGSG